MNAARFLRLGSAVLTAGLLAACAVGPDYVRPAVGTPAAYKEAQGWKPAQPQDQRARGKWWEMFNDAVLNGLENELAISNQNIRIAEAQYRQARAQAQAARAAYFPTIAANASTTRGRLGSSGSTVGRGVASERSVSLDASWEADVWGSIRRSVEAGNATAQASAADLNNAQLSAQAELAQDYFMLRVTDEEKRLYERTVAAFERSLQLTRNQYAVGVAARADVVQAETQLKSAQAQAIDLDVQRSQLEHAIAILLGRPPAEFTLEPAPFALALPDIPVGLPSDLLERRPDIAAAERLAAAANARIGVARAAYFPALTLSASGGFQSMGLVSLFSTPARVWSLGAGLAETVFNGGLRAAQNAQAIAAFDQAVATYRQTVLGGFQEVEDNLAALRILEQEAELQDQAVKAARESVTLTTNQYQAGTVSYLNVVTVQATALANERTAYNIMGRRLSAAVLLIKAIGGKWEA